MSFLLRFYSLSEIKHLVAGSYPHVFDKLVEVDILLHPSIVLLESRLVIPRLERLQVFILENHILCKQKHNYIVKILNFGTPENFAVIYLKFKQTGQTLGYFVMMQMEKQTVKTLIRLLLWEQSDLGLHCLPRPICPKYMFLLCYSNIAFQRKAL